MQGTALIAIGGNALVSAHEPATVAVQRSHVARACRAIAAVIADGWRVVVTHGNGPQVGAALLRSERAASEAYPLPLDVCVASTQGEIGCLLQQGLADALAAKHVHRSVATLLTQVVVDIDDPAFARPTKPIGPFYGDADVGKRRALGWTLIEQRPHGWRRLVASPQPRAIVEESIVRTLVEADVVVIALGGGGIPVMRATHHLTGVEAVIDKDLASALLATRLGVDQFVLATDVDRVYVDYGLETSRGLDRVTADDLKRYATNGQFPPGTMGPKVEAALRFVNATGNEAVVTSYEQLNQAFRGRAGTRVLARTHIEDRHGSVPHAHHGSRRPRLSQFQRRLPR